MRSNVAEMMKRAAMSENLNVGKVLRRACAMGTACGVGGVDVAILFCSLLSLAGSEIEPAINSKQILQELYEETKRFVGRGIDAHEVLERAQAIAKTKGRGVSAVELFCLLGLYTPLSQVFEDKGLGREFLIELVRASDVACQTFENDGDPFVDLEALIGLGSVKNEVRKLVDLVRFNTARQANGLESESLTNNFVFTGNPGTGKTTVARIIARIYTRLGALKKGHLIEVGRADLVAGYVGQSAERTKKVVESALDGVLFIDEAYSLAQGGHSDYGQEVIATLVQEMERYRSRLVVVVAGYGDEMKKLVNMNPGLQSRFTKYIHFPDYTCEELVQVFQMMARKGGYSCSDEAVRRLGVKIETMVRTADRNSGNARFVRNLFGEVKERMASRVMACGSPRKASLVTIEAEDIP